jgi:alginate O-acetyltransferase complex protein AlgI
MLFNSLQFAIFFPVVTLLFFVLPGRTRTPLLLAASCFFYMAFIPAYILILFVTIAIDYVAGIYIERTQGARRHALLVISILSTCAVLFVFKYFDFFTANFVAVADMIGWNLSKPMINIILPIGLSFHTFQSLSYVIEVYRGNQKAEKDWVTYATYVMFFPQLVAGPIERPQNLLHQFREAHPFDYERITSGLKRMAWGFFKKCVVADRLAIYVNDVYSSPRTHNGLQLTLGTFFFAYQIYCDFSGYSDIAIGTARVLGFSLMENFNTPYYSKSITEFWHRWHISLSTWFRDYLYLPLVSRFGSPLGWCITILITFGVSGLWHGANWTYVVWGLLNGFYLLAGAATLSLRNRFFATFGLGETDPVRAGIRIFCTFFLTCVGWVAFRARNLGDIGYVLTHFFRHWDFGAIKTEHFMLRQLPVAFGVIILLETAQLLNRGVRLAVRITHAPLLPRWAFYFAFLFMVIMLGVYKNAYFIYFQF